jgi:hypothetical protein
LVNPVPKSRREYAEELVTEAKKREFQGLVKYGDFDPKTDKRNMIHEGLDEVIDKWNYNKFDSLMRPDRKEYHENVKKLVLALYILDREEEEQRTHKIGGAT